VTYNDRHIRRRAALFIDVLVSLFRRWVLRPAYREPALSTALAGESADTPLFHMLDNSLPRRSVLVNGAILSLVFLSALTFSIGRGARGSLSRVFVHTMIRVLDVLDADHDHIISPWEVSTAPAALRRLDGSHDGKLSPEECGFYLAANPKTNLDPRRV
jgi:hypothetical protein